MTHDLAHIEAIIADGQQDLTESVSEMCNTYLRDHGLTKCKKREGHSSRLHHDPDKRTYWRRDSDVGLIISERPN